MNTFPVSYGSILNLKKLLGVRVASFRSVLGDVGKYGEMQCIIQKWKSLFFQVMVPGGGMMGSDSNTIVRGPGNNLVFQLPRPRTVPAHAWSSLETLGVECQNQCQFWH